MGSYKAIVKISPEDTIIVLNKWKGYWSWNSRLITKEICLVHLLDSLLEYLIYSNIYLVSLEIWKS